MKQLLKNKYWKIAEYYDINKVLYLLIDRPGRINSCNNYIWKNKQKQYHREYDLPTIIDNYGHISWYRIHKCHRENNKPAIIYSDKQKSYYINGYFVKSEN